MTSLLRSSRREGGSMSVEVVLLTPILVMFMLLVVAGGRYVSVQSDIEAAARDAARAASFERTYGEAVDAAKSVARGALDSSASCTIDDVGGANNFHAGGLVEIELECQVPNDELGLIGLRGDHTMSATGAAPLDTYRRTGTG